MNKPAWAMTVQDKETEKKKNSITLLNDLLVQRKDEVQTALKDVMSADYFRRLVVTALGDNPKLAKCTMVSIYQSALQSAQLGLEPNTPLQEAYLIPYGDKCSFQVGRNGWIKLAYRTGLVKYVNAIPVYEGEEFVWQPGKDPEVYHLPDIEIPDSARLITAYAVAVLNDNTRIYEVLRTREWKKMKASAKGDGPGWKKWPERMICRSALKRLIRTRLPVNEFFVQKDPAVSSGQITVIDEKTGEILEEGPKVSRYVSEEIEEIIEAEMPQETPKAQLDGAKQEEDPRDDQKTSIKMSAAQFWTELKTTSEFWKTEITRADAVQLMREKHGEKATLAKLSPDLRLELLNDIDKLLKEKQLLAEDDDVNY